MSFLRCLEVAPLWVLWAGADLADQPTLHQAGKACACRAWSACDPLCDLFGGQSVAVRECIEDRLIDAIRRWRLPPRGVERDPEAGADLFQRGCRQAGVPAGRVHALDAAAPLFDQAEFLVHAPRS